MGRIIDLVETSPGHNFALLGRAIQVVRIAERDLSRPIEPSDLVIAQRDRDGCEVILKLLPGAGSDNRQHSFGLDPGDSDLAGLRANLFSYRADCVDRCIVVRVIGMLHAGFQIGRAPPFALAVFAGKNTGGHRRPGHDAKTESVGHGQQLALRRPLQEVVFNLNGRDRRPASEVSRVGGGRNSPGREIGETSINDLASADEIVETAGYLFHWCDEVIHVNEIEIDAIGLQPFKTRFDRLDHVLPVVAQASEGGLGGRAARELRGDNEVVAVRSDGLAYQCLGNAVLIIVGYVDKVAACVGESGDDARDFFRGRTVAPGLTEHTRAERELRYFQSSSFAEDFVSHETILAVDSLNRKYALKSMLRSKKYAKEIYASNRRPGCGSSASPSRRTLEACHTLPSVWWQGVALLRAGTKDTQHHSENAGATAPQPGSGRNRCA